MGDYKSFLAASVLSEGKVVTYRVLSRALKVHVNEAKEMLYEFYQQQNGRRRGRVHATYLLSGVARQEKLPKQDNDDTQMQSSLFLSSSMPQPEDNTGETGVLSIILVKEEDLDDTRSQFEHISSIHVYSLGPNSIKDLQVLSDSAREVQQLCAAEDPLEFAPRYGTIINKNIKRRTGKRLPPTAAPAIIPAKTQYGNLKPADSGQAPKGKQESKPAQPSNAKDFFGRGKEVSKLSTNTTVTSLSSKEVTPDPLNPKRDTSNLLKPFAKIKPSLTPEGTDSPLAFSTEEDTPMKDGSDSEDETYIPPAQIASSKIVGSELKSREYREAALKKMMEDDDDDGDFVTACSPEVETVDEVEEIENRVKAAAETTVISGGEARRRGRRRVMKKKTIKDEEGYLVTKEEPAWESFSEDELVAPPKPKVQSSTTSARAKKPTARTGQGNIMAFFGKK